MKIKLGDGYKDIVEIARITPSCRGCMRIKDQVAPEVLGEGDFEWLKAQGVPEMDMEEFDAINMKEIEQLNADFLQWQKEQDSAQGRLL